MDNVNWNLITVVVVAFVVGYAIVSVISFIQGKLKSLQNNTVPPKNQNQRNNDKSKCSGEKAEQSEGQQQSQYYSWQQEQERIRETHRRQEESRWAQENERLREEQERRRQEESRRESSLRGRTGVKDERYYSGILGLSGRMTFDDVKRRYRMLVAQYHPDKVNHLGPKLKALAEAEMTEINEAFGFFKRRYRQDDAQ